VIGVKVGTTELQVNTDVLDTVLLSLHPAEVVAANDEVSLEDQS